MNLNLNGAKLADINPRMYGLFFEDINYGADGGLYAEMIENRSFEFVDAHGDRGDYYTVFDGGYGWSVYPENAKAEMAIVSGSPLYAENPHYLRFTSSQAGAGICNKAYDGITLKEGEEYRVSFYARNISASGNFVVSVISGGKAAAFATVPVRDPRGTLPNFWEKYEVTLTARKSVRHAKFVLSMSSGGTAEFDFVSMFPADAVKGIFRRDLFEKLDAVHPGFIRFPGGCIIEGNTLANRYDFKNTLTIPERRKNNWNRWAVHENSEKNHYHSVFSHYNQTYGMGYYEFFLLCEALGAEPLPVLSVGLACQYQSFEYVPQDSPAFAGFVQDALDLIEFANGPADSPWGKVRAELGHPEPFNLKMVGIGNEQWQTDKIDFFSRYEAFEKAIHAKYPKIRLIGSAGPAVKEERYGKAWAFYDSHADDPDFVYAVDEHYYMKPQWFLDNVGFYDSYPRTRRVFSGEYAAHPESRKNTLEGALCEAAFMTGVERNADVVRLSSYAPLFGRVNFWQWRPDLIWFDDETSFGTPSWYVQKMFSNNVGDEEIDLGAAVGDLRSRGIYVCASRTSAQKGGDYIVKIVNLSGSDQTFDFTDGGDRLACVSKEVLSGPEPEAENTISDPDRVRSQAEDPADPAVPAGTFAVLRLRKA